MLDLAVPAVLRGHTRDSVSSEYIGYQLVVVSISSAAISGLFLGLRLYTRKYIVRSLGWDDWWIICAWLSGVALTIADCIQTEYGAGSHKKYVESTYEMFLKIQLILGSTYTAAIAFAKVSICCLYLRLSPDRTFRLLVYLTIAFTASYSLACLLLIIFSCSPIDAFWDSSLTQSSTKCMNSWIIYIVQATLNILTDFSIIVLPLPTIWRLQLPFRQKLTVSSVFAIGFLICIISIIRLRYVIKVYHSTDPTWDNNALSIWSVIEAHDTIFCACVATLKPLVNRLFPRLLGRTPSSVSYNGNENGNGSGHSAPAQPPGSVSHTKLSKRSSNGSRTFRFSSVNSETNSDAGARTFSLRGYRERVMGKSQHKAVVTSGAMARLRDTSEGDSDSQNGIIDGMEHDMAYLKNGGVFVTRTVRVS